MNIRQAIVIVFACALIAVACGDDDGGLSSQIRNRYLEICEASQTAAFCGCVIDEIETRFSEEEFIRFGVEATEELHRSS